MGYIRAITIKDSINSSTGEYNNRTVDIDNYRNFGVEARYLGDYTLGGKNHSFSGGLRYFNGNTYRYRDGVGTTGSDYTVETVTDVGTAILITIPTMWPHLRKIYSGSPIN